MTESVFRRWRLAQLALFLGAEALWYIQGGSGAVWIGLTAALAPFLWATEPGKWRLLLSLPAIALFGLSGLRFSTLLAERAMTALHPALCALAFALAVWQLAAHGRAAVAQWCWPVLWVLLAGVFLGAALGWPEIDDLWFLLIALIAELARCGTLLTLFSKK